MANTKISELGSTDRKALINATHGSIYNVMHYGATGDGATDDSTAIQAAIDAAYAAGGGTVFFPALTFVVGTALVPKNSVTLQGSGVSFALASDNRTVEGKTILKAPSSGNNNCIEYNIAARGSQPSGSEGWTEGLKSFWVCDMGFLDFKTAIRIGGDMNPGGYFCGFVNIGVSRYTEWALRIENTCLSRFSNIQGGDAIAGYEGDFLLQASVSAFNYGNNYLDEIFFEPRQVNGRGLEISARRAGTDNNDNQLYRVQINHPSNTVTASVTTNGTTTFSFVTPSEADNFPVDMPCALFQADAQGLEKYRTVFVTSNDGSGNITLSDTAGGSNITATGSGTITLRQFGYPLLALVGYGDSDPALGGRVEPTGLFGIDMEGYASCQFLLQNCLVTGDIGTFGGKQDTASAKLNSAFCLRNARGALTGSQIATFDIDEASDLNNFQFFGFRIDASNLNQNPKPVVQRFPRGMVAYEGTTGDAQGGMSLVGLIPPDIDITSAPTRHNQMIGVRAGASSFVHMQAGFGLRQWSENSSAQLTANHVGIGCNRSIAAGAITWTLPPLTAYAAGTQECLIGCIFGFQNANPAAGLPGTLIIRTYQGQTFTTNFAASTSELNIAAATALEVGAKVQLTTTGTLPTGLATATDYWVTEKVDTDTVKLSTTRDGAAVTFSDDGTGTHTITVVDSLNRTNTPKTSITLERGDSILLQAMYDMTDNTPYWGVLSYIDHSALP